MSGTFALREGWEAAMPYLLTSAWRDALRLVRNAADDVKPTRSETFAVVGATVLDGVADAPLPNAVLLVEDGRIARIGTRAQVKLAKGIPTVQGRGLTVIPGVRAEGWSVSDLGWGPGALARGIVAMRLAVHNDATLREVRQGLDRDGGLAPRVLEASDTSSARVLREGAPADFVIVQGALRTIPDSPSRIRWVAIGGRLYSAQVLRNQ
jgi:cytosine/adenosine deaminase-related metal-dependent hydrolase